MTQHNKMDGGNWTETDFKVLFKVEVWKEFKELMAKVDRAVGK